MLDCPFGLFLSASHPDSQLSRGKGKVYGVSTFPPSTDVSHLELNHLMNKSLLLDGLVERVRKVPLGVMKCP